jgi:hypothetical protein
MLFFYVRVCYTCKNHFVKLNISFGQRTYTNVKNSCKQLYQLNYVINQLMHTKTTFK